MNRTMVGNYYKVCEGGSMYENFRTKEEALDKALKISVGRQEETLVYRVVCTVDLIDAYDIGKNTTVEVTKSKMTTETLALRVIPRKEVPGRSLKEQGGWTDYEA